jgi:hypothetical protein
MQEASVVTIVVALFGIVGTMSGVWLGRYQERRNEAMKWRRERCLETYTDLLATCTVLLVEATKAALISDPQDKAVREQNEKVLEQLMKLLRLTDKSALIVSPEADEAVRDLMTYYQTNIANRAVNWPKPTEQEWNQLTIQAANLYRKTADIARMDIGLDVKRYKPHASLLRFDDQLL